MSETTPSMWAKKYDKEREYQAQYRKKNAEKRNQQKKEYNARPGVKSKSSERNKAHPHRRVWARLRDKISAGKIKRQPCVYCSESEGHAHHEDYSKPFDVVWVCSTHHKAIHGGAIAVMPEHISHIDLQVRKWTRKNQP